MFWVEGTACVKSRGERGLGEQSHFVCVCVKWGEKGGERERE